MDQKVHLETGGSECRTEEDLERVWVRRWPFPDRRHLARQVRAWMQASLDLLLPPVCACCFESLESARLQPTLCQPCREQLLAHRMDDPCPRCGVECAAGRGRARGCLRCRRQRLAFQRVVPFGRYEGAIRQAVIRMKHFREAPLTAAVGGLVAEHLARRWRRNVPEVVVPVPRQWLGRWLHGSGAAEVLADVVAAELGLPSAGRALCWQRRTCKQSLLPLPQRRRNLKGALKARRLTRLEGAHVLLLDDIMTTGATASEASRALRAAGVRCVTVGVVGRALVDHLRGGR